MLCPNCGTEIQEEDAFCYKCGYKVEKPVDAPTVAPYTPETQTTGDFCPNCGGKVEKEDAFCMRCGYRLQAPTPSAAEIPDLSVPVGDAGFVKQGQAEMICRMCGCKIPASSTICPICQQPTAYARSAPRVTPYYTQPVAKKKPFNVLALLGFIFGIIGLLGCLGLEDEGGFIMAIPGLVLSILGLIKSKKLGTGKGFAIAGIVISAVAIAIFVLVLGAEILEEVLGSGVNGDPTYPDSGTDLWGDGHLY